eukprot:gene10857-16971_t
MANNPLGSTENLLRGGNAMCHLDGGMPTFALEHSQSHIPAQHHHAHPSYPDFGQMHMRQGQEQQAHLQPGQHLPGLGSMNKLDQLPAAHQQHANLPGHPPQFAYMPGMTMDQVRNQARFLLRPRSTTLVAPINSVAFLKEMNVEGLVRANVASISRSTD